MLFFSCPWNFTVFLIFLRFFHAAAAAWVQIPPELVKMAEEFQGKVDSGQARKASSGFSGKGFTFDDSEQSESQQVMPMLDVLSFRPFDFGN